MPYVLGPSDRPKTNRPSVFDLMKAHVVSWEKTHIGKEEEAEIMYLGYAGPEWARPPMPLSMRRRLEAVAAAGPWWKRWRRKLVQFGLGIPLEVRILLAGIAIAAIALTIVARLSS